jgi:hypothetical protein
MARHVELLYCTYEEFLLSGDLQRKLRLVRQRIVLVVVVLCCEVAVKEGTICDREHLKVADLRLSQTKHLPRAEASRGSLHQHSHLRDVICDHFCLRRNSHASTGLPITYRTMDDPIASAVVLPEEPLPPASPNSNKRRQSSVTEDNAKRPRLDDDAPNGRRGSTNDTKPAVPVRRERGRERRLFGAVLGALSQAPSTTAAQKRRSEIEKRQLVQRRQESEESEQRKAERIAKRKVQRWKEQRRFEEQSVGMLPMTCDERILIVSDATTSRQLTEHGSLPPNRDHATSGTYLSKACLRPQLTLS